MPVVCGVCGKDNPHGSNYCNHCGKKIEVVITTPTTDGKVCPHCGAVNPVVASFCQGCIRSFPPRDSQEVPEHHGRRCWRCDAQVDESATFCTACGTDLSTMSTASFPSVRGYTIPLVVALLFAGAFVLDLFSAARLFAAELPPEDYYGVDVSGFLNMCGVLVVIFACCALIASVMSYRRGGFTMILIAGALSMLGIGPLYLGSLLSLVAIILVAVNRDEFE